MFTVLPFGLATACFVFTKVLQPLVRYWRSMGMRMVLYIDDGIVAGKGLEEAKQFSGIVRDTLERAGLVVSDEKSVWEPVRVLQWLGFMIDLNRGIISVPREKIENIKSSIKSMMGARSVRARDLASVVGKLIQCHGTRCWPSMSPDDQEHVCNIEQMLLLG